MRIGFLGLGSMGKPMARNLLGLGHTLTVFSRTPGKASDLIAKGAKEAATVAEAVADAEVVITMFPDDDALTAVAMGPGGLLQNLPPQSIHLCMSSISVGKSAELASAHASAGQGYVAAPVFGRAEDAASRRIWIMAGGPEPQVNRCLSIFIALGRGLTRVGPKAALAHALKQGCNAISETLADTIPDMLASCEQAEVPPADYLRFLDSAVFKIPLMDVEVDSFLPPLLDPAELPVDQPAHEMLAALQATREPAKTVPAAEPARARPKDKRARGRNRHKHEHPDRHLPVVAPPAAAGVDGGITPPPAVPPGPVFREITPPPVAPQKPVSRGITPPPVVSPKPVSVETTPPPVAVPTSGSREIPPPAPPVAAPDRTLRRDEPNPPAVNAGNSAKNLKAAEPAPVTHQRGEASGATFGKTAQMAIPKEAMAAVPPSSDPAYAFPATDGERPLMLDLNATSHFELVKGRVWAWSEGKRYGTSWRKLSEVELAFHHTLLLSVQRHILLRPEAVLDLRNTFGGGAKARLGGNHELDISRAAAPRLRLLLGM